MILSALNAYNFYTFYRANAPGLHAVPNDYTMIRACAVGIAIEWLMLLYMWAAFDVMVNACATLPEVAGQNWKQFAIEIVIAAVFCSLWSGSDMFAGYTPS